MNGLPSLDATTSALSRVLEDPATATLRMCRPLFAILRASYNDDLESEFESLADQYTEASKDADDLQQDTVIAISRLPSGMASELVPDLIGFLESDPEFYELAHALVATTFPINDAAAKIDSDSKQGVLAAIISNQSLWECDMDFGAFLQERGLPGDQSKCEELLANSHR